MIALAWRWPSFGAKESPYHLHTIVMWEIAGIFLLYGMGLGWRKLRDGVRLWQLHLVTQLSIFLIFPLFVFGLYTVFNTPEYHTLWVGTFYLATLPSTVSSSVVMVAVAKGNVPAAIFNASLASVLGVFLTPAWMGWFLSRSVIPIDPMRAILAVSLQVLLPMAIGAALYPLCGAFVERHRHQTRLFDQSVVLLLVYTSFCDSFESGAFELFRPLTLLMLSAGMVTLFFVIYAVISVICRMMRMNRKDAITARFCGSKKSLTHGTAIGAALFAGYSELGVILLPLMLYHALQLIIVSVIAQKQARADAAGNASGNPG